MKAATPRYSFWGVTYLAFGTCSAILALGAAANHDAVGVVFMVLWCVGFWAYAASERR